MRFVVGCSRCRGCSRGDYIGIGGIKGRRKDIQFNGYREEKISQGMVIRGGRGTTTVVVWGYGKGEDTERVKLYSRITCIV